MKYINHLTSQNTTKLLVQMFVANVYSVYCFFFSFDIIFFLVNNTLC